jgi:hypothetical protein
MTTLQITGLVVFIVVIAGILGYLFQAGKNLQEPPTENFDQYTEQELENIKLIEELYNRDTRSQAAKQALEVEVVEPEFVNQEDQTSQVFPPEAAINTQTTSETQEKNPESSVDKPKKKRKYYPKNKK